MKNAHVGLYFRGPCKWYEPAEICERPNATQVGRKIEPNMRKWRHNSVGNKLNKLFALPVDDFTDCVN